MVGVVRGMANQMTEPADQIRAVVSWESQGAPIKLTLHGPDGEVGFAPTGKVPPYHGSDPRQNI